jgi:4a-hydroxytetrahydrobiopterin dehydratase
MTRLSDSEIRQRLQDLSGWTRREDSIVKEYEFDDFVGAIEFVRAVAARAEEANHHPDIEIHYNKVKLTLSTHSEGGVTEKDIEAAGSFDQSA